MWDYPTGLWTCRPSRSCSWLLTGVTRRHRAAGLEHRGELYAHLVGCCMAATNQAGLEREVELFQLFVVWQPRQLQRVAEPTALAEADICFQE
jgi:hypothetical protein